MLDKFKKYFKYIVFLVLALLVAIGFLTFYLQKRELERERDELYRVISIQEDTIEIKEGIFQKKVVELGDVSTVLDTTRKEIADLKATIESQKKTIVHYTQLSVTWRKKYEGMAEAYQEIFEGQTTEPGTTPGIERLKVTFKKEFGPFRVDGYTITSPPEAFVAVTQSRPLILGVALTQDKDGDWSTVVSSSEDGFEVDVNVSAVDRKLELITWRDKISTDLDVGFLGKPSLGVGVKYGDKLAVGPKCSAYLDDEVSWSCGVGISWRPFDR